MKKSLCALVAVAALSLAACGGGGGGNSGGDTGGGTGGDGGGTATSYTVTPSVSGSGGSISPAKAVSVKSGATTEFTVTPNSGYTLASVGGTCGGTLSGTTYTTKPVTANCTVVASFSKGGTGGTGSASIANCYTIPKTVQFRLLINGGMVAVVTAGPMIYNGQAVTGFIVTYPTSPVLNIATYYTVTGSGVTLIANVSYNNNPSAFLTRTTYFPPEIPNMQPGQSINQDLTTVMTSGGAGVRTTSEMLTLVGFETVTMDGTAVDGKTFSKTFSNTCHFKTEGIPDSDFWIAPGYGPIRGSDRQYNGDL